MVQIKSGVYWGTWQAEPFSKIIDTIAECSCLSDTMALLKSRISWNVEEPVCFIDYLFVCNVPYSYVCMLFYVIM